MVKVSFETSSEKGVEAFKVERSFDAKSWKLVYLAASKSDLGAKYEFEDCNSPNKSCYYRLTEVQSNGKLIFHKIIYAELEGESSKEIYDLNGVKVGDGDKRAGFYIVRYASGAIVKLAIF